MNDRRQPTKLLTDPDQVYRTDRWSRYQWQRFLDDSTDAADVIDRGANKIYSFPRFCREVFHRLYADRVEHLQPVKPEDQWAVKAHEELVGMPDFGRLRRRCRGDRLFAGTAAAAFAELVIDKLPDPPTPLEDPEPLREQVRGLMQFARNLQAQGENTTEVQNLTDNLRQQGQNAVAAANNYADSLDPAELRQTLRAACEAGHEAVDQAISQLDAFCGWGMGSSMSGQSIGAEVKAQLANQISRNTKLQELAREAGRLRRIAATKQRSKADHARNEVTDIERGNDLGRLLPSELVKLTDPALALEFARGFVERSLLQYQLNGKETQGKGPVVVCIDQSSSMEGANEIWSKAIALALLQVATMQKRSCRVIHFNGDLARVDDWKAGRVEPMQLLQSMATFYGGGTDFEPALSKALEAISNEPKLKKADVILITDGEAHLSDNFLSNWNRARKMYEFSTYGVHVDSPGGVPPEQLRAVADKTIGLVDVANDQVATDALLTI